MIPCVEECGRYAKTYCKHENQFACKPCSDVRHQVQVLKHHDVYPVCEKCEEAPASVECDNCGPIKLCVQCDATDHAKIKRMGHPPRLPVKVIKPVPMTPPQPKRTPVIPPRPMKQPRKPSAPMSLTCKVITKRVETARKTDTSVAMPDVKSKIVKIIDWACGTGNEHEAEKAKRIAKGLMDMYQVTLMETKKEGSKEENRFEEAIYSAKIVSTLRLQAPILIRDWFGTLAACTTAFFPDLVGVCVESGKPVYTFYGHEPSAWAAVTLFAELFHTIWYHRKEYADQNACVTAAKQDDFALGACLGLSMDGADEAAGIEKPLADALAVVRIRGRAMLKNMYERMKLYPIEKKTSASEIDLDAYAAGKKKGEEIDVNSFGKLKIEDA